MLCPNDHLKTIVELLRPGGADLARRWVAALLLVPPEEREAVVDQIEQRILDEYADRDDIASGLVRDTTVPDAPRAINTGDTQIEPKPASRKGKATARTRSKAE